LGFTHPIAESNSPPRDLEVKPIAEFSLEFEEEDSLELEAVSNSPQRDPKAQTKVTSPRRDPEVQSKVNMPQRDLEAQSKAISTRLDPEAQSKVYSPRRDPETESKVYSSPSKVRFSAMFGKKRSDVSDLTSDESPSRMSSFLDSPSKTSSSPRSNKGSDLSIASSDNVRNEAPLRIGDVSKTKGSNISDDTTAESTSPVNPNGEGRHSRIPGVLRMSLAALKRSPDQNTRKHGSG
jgi:hypothetical protein